MKWKGYWIGVLIVSALGWILAQSFIVVPVIVALAAALAFFLYLLSPAPATETKQESEPMYRLKVSAVLNTTPPEGFVSNWLTPDEKAELFKDASPENVPLVLRNNGKGCRLTDPVSGKQAPFDNNRMPKVDLWGVNVRGSDHYKAAWRNLSFGDRVELVHEPENPHDPNAVAIQFQGRTIGYYNRGMAKRLVKRGMTDLEAHALTERGDSPGVLAAPSAVWDQIGRPWQ